MSDILKQKIANLKDKCGVRLLASSQEDRYKVEDIDMSQIKEMNSNENRAHLVVPAASTIAALLGQLEVDLYHPSSDKSSHHESIFFRWNNMLFLIASIPKDDIPVVRKYLKDHHHDFVAGIPTMINGLDPTTKIDGHPAELFPLRNRLTFAVKQC